MSQVSPEHTARLVDWWAAGVGRSVHPEDLADIADVNVFKNDVTPVPYVGNLTKAKLVMVMLNPGHKGEEELRGPRDPHEDEARKRCLVQDMSQDFWPLTTSIRPDGQESGGRKYWRSIFKSYAASKGDIETMYARIARAVCCVQMVPYPSRTAPNVSEAIKLKSVRMVQEWVSEEIRLAIRPVIVFRGWPYLGSLRDKPNDTNFLGFKPDINFLRRPSFNPKGRYSVEAARALDRVLGP